MLSRWMRVIGLSLIAVACLQCGRENPHAVLKPEPPPTVILISIDALRADHLGCYGYDRATSPAIDRLAADAVVFEDAVTPASWTLPSFYALFTSRCLPVIWTGKTHLAIPEALPVMPEYFRQAGYATAGFGDTAYLNGQYGFARGFDLYQVEGRQGTAAILSQALTWLRAEEAPQRFLFMHTLDVHGPFTPQEPYRTLFVQPSHLVEPAEGEGSAVSDKSHVYGMIPGYQYLEGHRNLDYYVAQYDGGIRYVDSLLGAFFDALKDDGIYDGSLIIVTADHGESLTENDYLLDHGVLTEQVVRIPLLVKFPESYGVTGRYEGQVSLIDIMPTCLEFLDLEPDVPLSGRSLFDMIRGQVDETAPYAFTHEGIMKQYAIRTRDWKFVRMVPGSREPQVWQTCPFSDPNDKEAVVEALYDLHGDPEENRNLLDSQPVVAARMAAELEKWLAEQERLREHAFTAEEVAIDEKTKQQLKALGYVND